MMETNESCPHMARCKMFGLFSYAGTLASWKILYCTSDHQRCERFKRAKSGQSVPDNLMPNGALLRKPAANTG